MNLRKSPNTTMNTIFFIVFMYLWFKQIGVKIVLLGVIYNNVAVSQIWFLYKNNENHDYKYKYDYFGNYINSVDEIKTEL